MHFTHISAIFIGALMQQTTAAPITEGSAVAPRGGSPGLYVCVGKDFQGVCKHYLPPSFNYCYTFEYGAFYRTISSAGADEGSVCTFYSKPDCHGEQTVINNPGFKDLGNWAAKAASFNCAGA